MANLSIAAISRALRTKGQNSKTTVKLSEIHSVRMTGAPKLLTDEGLAAHAETLLTVKVSEKYETEGGKGVSSAFDVSGKDTSSLLRGELPEGVEADEAAPAGNGRRGRSAQPQA